MNYDNRVHVSEPPRSHQAAASNPPDDVTRASADSSHQRVMMREGKAAKSREGAGARRPPRLSWGEASNSYLIIE